MLVKKLGRKNHETFRSMGIDHSIKHRKNSRISLEGNLDQTITLLEKKNGINNMKETCLLIGISILQK